MRMRLPAWLLPVSLAALLVQTPDGAAQEADGPGPLRLRGSNTLRWENYHVTGDRDASPYQETGPQVYDELDFTVSQRLSTFRRWSLYQFGVLNDSFYRSPYEGYVPERLKLTYVDGEIPWPLRIEAGDVYGYFSNRTLQRSLKGVQLELQPRLLGLQQSLLLLSGVGGQSWRDIDAADNTTHGASWLFREDWLGTLALNYVTNSRQSDSETGALDRSQQTMSVAAEYRLQVLTETWTVEGEVAVFSGDHDGLTTPESGQSVRDEAYFFQLAGRSALPLTYRFRFEQTGNDFRPEGAVSTPARKAYEAHAAWRFDTGTRLRARYLRYRHDWQTDNPVDSDTVGLNLSGPFEFLWSELSGDFDAFVQDTVSHDRTTDASFSNVSLNLSKGLTERWQGRLGLLAQYTHNRVGGVEDSATWQASFAASRDVDWLGWQGYVEPGLVVRRLDQPDADSNDIMATFACQLVRGPHTLTASLGADAFDRAAANASDLELYRSTVRYDFRTGQDLFGIEVQTDHRRPSEERATDSYYVGLTWIRTFKNLADVLRPPRLPGPPPPALAAAAPTTARTAARDELLLTSLRPGVSLDRADEVLAGAGLKTPAEVADINVYEARLLDELEQRQRLCLVPRGAELDMAVLLVDLDAPDDPQGTRRTFERVRKTMLDAYGRADVTHERGDFGPQLADRLAEGTFVRIMEWYRSDGVLRLGIPARLDGQVRIEIQFAHELPPPAISRWSLMPVR